MHQLLHVTDKSITDKYVSQKKVKLLFFFLIFTSYLFSLLSIFNIIYFWIHFQYHLKIYCFWWYIAYISLLKFITFYSKYLFSSIISCRNGILKRKKKLFLKFLGKNFNRKLIFCLNYIKKYAITIYVLNIWNCSLSYEIII